MMRREKPRRLRRWEVLETLVKRNGWTKGAELGVFKGRVFFHLLDTCPGLTLIGVDTWLPGDPALDIPELAKKRPGDEGHRSYSQFPLEEFATKVIGKATAYGDRAMIMRMTTAEAARMLPDHCVEFVFVDGDHTEAGVRADIDAWTPKIQPGGMLLGHDSDLPSVRRAIEALVPGWHSYSDSVWGRAV